MKGHITCCLFTILLYGCSHTAEYHARRLDELARSHNELAQRVDSIKAALTDSLNVTSRELAVLEESVERNADKFREYRRTAASIAIPDHIIFSGVRIDFDTPDMKERMEKELLLIAENQAQLRLYAQRGSVFFPLIDSILDTWDLSPDAKFIPVVESALRSDALSYAHASGPWQFIGSTGKRYGMSHTDWVDERRNMEKATNGACKYLVDLIRMFGDPILAYAAYNAGEGTIAKAIKEQGTRNYFDLILPNETERYVFRLMAMKLIFEDPEHYGILLDDRDWWDRVERDTVTVKVNHSLTLRMVAEWCRTTQRQVRLLNSELKGDRWGPGTYLIYLPLGTRQYFVEGLKALRSKD